MKIQLWNAFASNNSGSYTIVGAFREAGLAARAAELLTPVLAAHTQWHGSEANPPIAESPLAIFARAQGVDEDSVDSEWPMYGESNIPQVAALEWQLLIHHSYTASMPRFFGAWIYALGGRVTCEIDHAHAPLVFSHELWLPWDNLGEEKRAQALVDFSRALAEPTAAFRTFLGDPPQARVVASAHGGVRLLAIYEDVVGGCDAVRALATGHGMNMRIEIREADDAQDPLTGWPPAPASSPPATNPQS